MASCTFGIVGHIDPDKLDNLVKSLEETHDIHLVAIKKSWGKLWLREDGP